MRLNTIEAIMIMNERIIKIYTMLRPRPTFESLTADIKSKHYFRV